MALGEVTLQEPIRQNAFGRPELFQALFRLSKASDFNFCAFAVKNELADK
jgi:hypothetical protein